MRPKATTRNPWQFMPDTHIVDWLEVKGFTAEATRALQAYAWPGNVRELENVIERAVVLSRSPEIGPIPRDRAYFQKLQEL